MPQAIHESMAFNSRDREVAIHCVFSVKDNTLKILCPFLYPYKGELTVSRYKWACFFLHPMLLPIGSAASIRPRAASARTAAYAFLPRSLLWAEKSLTVK